MSTPDKELIEQIIKIVQGKLEPLDSHLWDARAIGLYLQRTPDYVRAQILPLPSFPTAIRLPGKAPRALYEPAEVKEWVLKHRERKSA